MGRARGILEEFVCFRRRPSGESRNRAAPFFIFLHGLGDFRDDGKVENDGGVPCSRRRKEDGDGSRGFFSEKDGGAF